MFIMIVVGIFTLAGFLHPEEFMCLVPGILYFLCIPSGFILLFIYSMVNMNVVSWGTREIPQTTDPQSDEDKVTIGCSRWWCCRRCSAMYSIWNNDRMKTQSHECLKNTFYIRLEGFECRIVESQQYRSMLNETLIS